MDDFICRASSPALLYINIYMYLHFNSARNVLKQFESVRGGQPVMKIKCFLNKKKLSFINNFSQKRSLTDIGIKNVANTIFLMK